MTENEVIGYAFEPSDYEALRNGGRMLFGDGTHFTPDQRRDLANMLHEVIGRAIPMKEEPNVDHDADRLRITALDSRLTSAIAHIKDVHWEMRRLALRGNKARRP